jgi:hypothetical protein
MTNPLRQLSLFRRLFFAFFWFFCSMAFYPNETIDFYLPNRRVGPTVAFIQPRPSFVFSISVKIVRDMRESIYTSATNSFPPA